MAEVKVRYNNLDIAAILKPGGMTLLTAGKYMGDNVEVLYTDPNPNVIQDQDDYIVLGNLPGNSNDTLAKYYANTLEEVEDYNVTSIIANFYNGKSALTHIYFPNVTTVYGNAFYNCSGLLGTLNFPALTTIDGGNSFRSIGSGVTNFIAPNLTTISGNYALSGLSGVPVFYFPSLTSWGGSYSVAYCNCKIVVPAITTLASDVFRGGGITEADFGPGLTNFPTRCFYSGSGSKVLTKLVIRNPNLVVTLTSVSGSTNSTSTWGNGANIYVPLNLLNDYLVDTNWAAVIASKSLNVLSIESTHTDPDAPIDLTLYYIDGTPISTT